MRSTGLSPSPCLAGSSTVLISSSWVISGKKKKKSKPLYPSLQGEHPASSCRAAPRSTRVTEPGQSLLLLIPAQQSSQRAAREVHIRKLFDILLLFPFTLLRPPGLALHSPANSCPAFSQSSKAPSLTWSAAPLWFWGTAVGIRGLVQLEWE